MVLGDSNCLLVNWDLFVGLQGKKLANRCLKYTNIREANPRVGFLAPALPVCKTWKKEAFRLLIPGENKL